MTERLATQTKDKHKIVETSCNIDFEKLFTDTSFNLDSSFSSINEINYIRGKTDIFLQLPINIKEQLLLHRNVSRLFDWQEQILKIPCIYNRGNLIYSSPTGGGKTLVSELIMMREVSSLSSLGCSLGFHVEEYASSKGSFPPRKRLKRRSIFVATIEKALLLLNSFIEEDMLDSLGVVVVDEIALREYICLDNSLYTVDSTSSEWQDAMKFDRAIYPSNKNVPRNVDTLIQLVIELSDSSSCLIFCPNKRNCEVTCQHLVKHLPSNKEKLLDRLELIKSLEFVTGGLCPILKVCIPKGIGYHHAGMADDERKIIEEGFLCGTLYILCCTSTLAAGVNLPASRVIIKSPLVANQPLSSVNYRQMIGRAGRPGLSKSGESIIMLEKRDAKLLNQIFGSEHSCISALTNAQVSDISNIILLLVTQYSSLYSSDFVNFFKATLYYQQLPQQSADEEINSKIKLAIDYLIEKKLIEMKNNFSLTSTNLGLATIKGGLDVKNINQSYTNLKNSLKQFVLSSDLHLIYLCSSDEMILPSKVLKEMIKLVFRYLYLKLSGLSESEQKLIHDTGLNQSIIYKSAYYTSNNIDTTNTLLIKWFNALLVYQLYSGRSIWSIYTEFDITRGAIQQLITNTVSNASALFRFTKVFFFPFTLNLAEFWCINLLFEEMVKKLSMIKCAEVLPLLEISGVKLARAKQLYQAGYHSVSDVAVADSNDLTKTIPHLSRRQASSIVSSAKLIIREKVEALQDEADEILIKLDESSFH